MKRLFTIGLLFLALRVVAVDRITTTITFTNTPADGDTLVFNATTRTFKTSVATPSTQITIGASAAGTATNAYLQIAGNPFGGGVIVSQTATNVVSLLGAVGQAITASMTGTWGTLAYSTQAVTTLQSVRIPITGEPTASVMTNIASTLVSNVFNLGLSTELILPGSTAMSNFVNTSIAQTISGAKSGTWAALGTDNEILTRTNATTFFGAKTLDNTWTGKNTFSLITNSVVGNSTITNTTYYGTVGLISGGYMNAVGSTNNTLTNSTLRGAVTATAALDLTRANITSLANGNNAAVNFGTETVYAKIKAGPSAAFTINGITGGANGRVLILDNTTAQAMTIAYDSGVDPTAGNRIYTTTGSDVSSSGNCTAVLIYDSESSRWKLIGFTPSASVSLANPTGIVSTTAANGVATTAMRSDAAPALSQSISPTWTGTHTFNNCVMTGTWTDVLTADNQVVTPFANMIILSSNDATAANRTFLLAAPSGIPAGKSCLVTIIWNGTNAGELVDDSVTGGHTARLSATWTPTQYDTLTLFYDGSSTGDWHEVGRSTN